MKNNAKLYQMQFSQIYPLLVNKVIKKGRSQDEVDQIIHWLTGYQIDDLDRFLKENVSYQDFFKQAPHMNERRFLIQGSICGLKLSEIDEPLLRDIRYLDKMIDELARGKAIEKILR